VAPTCQRLRRGTRGGRRPGCAGPERPVGPQGNWAACAGRKTGLRLARAGKRQEQRCTGPRSAGGDCRPDQRWAKASTSHIGVGGKGLKGKGFLIFLKTPKQLNSNLDLNPNTQKQCTSMYATLNSYILLIN
jgi:hypothetical protein